MMVCSLVALLALVCSTYGDKGSDEAQKDHAKTAPSLRSGASDSAKSKAKDLEYVVDGGSGDVEWFVGESDEGKQTCDEICSENGLKCDEDCFPHSTEQFKYLMKELKPKHDADPLSCGGSIVEGGAAYDPSMSHKGHDADCGWKPDPMPKSRCAERAPRRAHRICPCGKGHDLVTCGLQPPARVTPYSQTPAPSPSAFVHGVPWWAYAAGALAALALVFAICGRGLVSGGAPRE
eukprot:TRINITY_DN65891_c0_g1_i1.p1 TRINITY_DN65891_c0_g1~~TRINITY_DN65891_c0_g1_i1.p1  ORF type:complete len:251 (-),score=29.21 TRINITY_DN65891_c0_g1_i1:104-808(-)